MTDKTQPKNTLYYGDNLDVLRRYVKDETVDLVYLDPPFNSNADYNVLFAAKDGTQAAAQIHAFEDTWHWDLAARAAFDETVSAGGAVANALLSFEKLIGGNDVLAYLSMMAPRLKELHRVLKETGSLYLHCDPTASHYLKLLLDAVFGPKQFRNEIIWRRHGAHTPTRSFGPIHDTLLFYTKSDDYYFKRNRSPYMRKHVEKRYTLLPDGRLQFTTGGNILTGAGKTNGDSGKPWRGFNPSAKNRHWAIPGYLTEQMDDSFKKLGTIEQLEALYKAGLVEINHGAQWPLPVKYLSPDDGIQWQDIWAYQPYTEGTVYGTDAGIDADVQWLGPKAAERLGYPTQKPVGLLSRVLASSCPDDGVVLDPFCGCGTTISAAEAAGLRWIGIDITIHAVALIEKRLRDTFGSKVSFQTVGMPSSIEEARELAARDKFQFQWWATYQLGARGEEKKGADKGIDGRLFFKADPSGPFQQIIISVKGGKLKATDVRDLRGVIEREKAEIAVLVSLETPTKQMRAEAASAGFFTSPWGKHPRLQLLTVEEMLDGKGIDYPRVTGVNQTFKTARKSKKPTAKSLGLFGN